MLARVMQDAWAEPAAELGSRARSAFANQCFHFLARVNFMFPGLCDAAIRLACQLLYDLCLSARGLA